MHSTLYNCNNKSTMWWRVHLLFLYQSLCSFSHQHPCKISCFVSFFWISPLECSNYVHCIDPVSGPLWIMLLPVGWIDNLWVDRSSLSKMGLQWLPQAMLFISTWLCNLTYKLLTTYSHILEKTCPLVVCLSYLALWLESLLSLSFFILSVTLHASLIIPHLLTFNWLPGMQQAGPMSELWKVGYVNGLTHFWSMWQQLLQLLGYILLSSLWGWVVW